MQSSSNEMSTPVSDSEKCKQTKMNTNALNSRTNVGSPNYCEVCYRSDVKLGRFRFKRCSSYWKGSYLVALDYGRQLYFTFYIS